MGETEKVLCALYTSSNTPPIFLIFSNNRICHVHKIRIVWAKISSFEPNLFQSIIFLCLEKGNSHSGLNLKNIAYKGAIRSQKLNFAIALHPCIVLADKNLLLSAAPRIAFSCPSALSKSKPWNIWYAFGFTISSTFILRSTNTISWTFFNCIRCKDLNWESRTFSGTRAYATTRNSVHHFFPFKLTVQSLHGVYLVCLWFYCFFFRK